MSVVFGVDPGVSGSISVIWLSDGEPASFSQRLNETEADIAEFVRGFDLERSFAVLEVVHSMPKQGVSSSFKFGQSYGFLRGLLTALQIRFIDVRPAKWQKDMKCLTKGDKNVTKAAAQRLWPKLKITHANADSLLLAEWGRRFGGLK